MKRYKIAIATIIICIGVRIFLLIVYDGRRHVDTDEYLILSKRLAKLDLHGHDGQRPPVYPLIMAFFNNNRNNIFMFQSLIGVAISFMLFKLTQRTTGNSIAAVAVALSYSFALHWLSYEVLVLTETVSVFCVVSFAYIYEEMSRRMNVLSVFLFGLIAAIATLTKPLLMILPLAGCCFITFRFRWNLKKLFKYLICFLSPVLILVCGWCFVNKKYTGYFTVTTLTGYNLTNHSGAFMEVASDEYKVIREVYLEERERNIKKTGSHSMTVFLIKDELLKKTGYSVGLLSKKLTQLSLELFRQKPLLYCKSVSISWLKFWRPPGPSTHVFLGREKLGKVLFYAEALYFIGISFIFLIISFCILTPIRPQLGLTQFHYFCMFIIWVASVGQALMEYGDNARYGVPFHTLTLYVVFYVLMNILRQRKKSDVVVKTRSNRPQVMIATKENT